MSLQALLFPSAKRKIPFDKTSKLILRIAHTVSTSLFLGAVYFDVVPSFTLHIIIAISGFLIIIRETIKGGLWILQLRSLFIWSKSLLLIWLIWTGNISLVPVMTIYLLGVLSSHTTKKIRKRKIVPPYTYD